jgi:thiol-disulfide isomerase/thioredoxin
MGRRVLIAIFICALCGGVKTLPAQIKDTLPSVEPIDVKGIEHLVHIRNGKILFLNVWATWCQPCVEEFPDLVKLYNDYQNAVVDIAAISVDYPDEVDSKILPFLASQHVPFKVYVANIKKDEDLINELNPSWSGAVPATFIFDANGKQRAFMFGQKTLKVFKAEIDSVLGSR